MLADEDAVPSKYCYKEKMRGWKKRIQGTAETKKSPLDHNIRNRGGVLA